MLNKNKDFTVIRPTEGKCHVNCVPRWDIVESVDLSEIDCIGRWLRHLADKKQKAPRKGGRDRHGRRISSRRFCFCRRLLAQGYRSCFFSLAKPHMIESKILQRWQKENENEINANKWRSLLQFVLLLLLSLVMLCSRRTSHHKWRFVSRGQFTLKWVSRRRCREAHVTFNEDEVGIILRHQRPWTNEQKWSEWSM